MNSFYIGLVVVWFVTLQAVASASCQNVGQSTRNYTLNIVASYGAPGESIFSLTISSSCLYKLSAFSSLTCLTIDGFARPILLVNGVTPGPVLEATQGETFVVTVNNTLAVQIGMHWSVTFRSVDFAFADNTAGTAYISEEPLNLTVYLDSIKYCTVLSM